ncbi:MAG: hypothetical protein V7727_02365 [Sneathiella sp.]
MKRETIKRVVGNVFANAGDMVIPVSIVRTSNAAHTPGLPEAVVEMSYSACLLKMQSPKGKSFLETGPVLDKSYNVSLLQCEDCVPVPGDILEIDGTRFTLQQVVSLDNGAGVLFEAWYQ